MSTFASGLSVTDRNTDLPFFPSCTWNLTQADIGLKTLPTFNYIQAFFDESLGVEPILAIFSGAFHDDGSPILSEIRFAFSGDKIQIKGSGFFMTGTNIIGQTVSSITIRSAPTTDLSRVIAFGGMR
jgi:hypothetical protein